jgi:hypothetical protein
MLQTVLVLVSLFFLGSFRFQPSPSFPRVLVFPLSEDVLASRQHVVFRSTPCVLACFHLCCPCSADPSLYHLRSAHGQRNQT